MDWHDLAWPGFGRAGQASQADKRSPKLAMCAFRVGQDMPGQGRAELGRAVPVLLLVVQVRLGVRAVRVYRAEVVLGWAGQMPIGRDMEGQACVGLNWVGLDKP